MDEIFRWNHDHPSRIGLVKYFRQGVEVSCHPETMLVARVLVPMMVTVEALVLAEGNNIMISVKTINLLLETGQGNLMEEAATFLMVVIISVE